MRTTNQIDSEAKQHPEYIKETATLNEDNPWDVLKLDTKAIKFHREKANARR
ncbi:hypothetical protein ACQZV8_01640 [Magnetococcales bacterium HHB-1]